MTTQPQGAVPELTLGWRLKMALAHGGIKRGEMAQALGYEDSALSRWMSDKGEPRRGVLAQWALLTQVDPHWLETGEGTPGGPTDGQPVTDTPGSGGGDKLARLTARKRDRTVTRRYPEAA